MDTRPTKVEVDQDNWLITLRSNRDRQIDGGQGLAFPWSRGRDPEAAPAVRSHLAEDARAQYSICAFGGLSRVRVHENTVLPQDRAIRDDDRCLEQIDRWQVPASGRMAIGLRLRPGGAATNPFARARRMLWLRGWMVRDFSLASLGLGQLNCTFDVALHPTIPLKGLKSR
jgi:hypothetical protein